MAIKFLESGSDATFGLEFWSASSGTVASDSTQSRTGPRSIKLTSPGTAAVARVSKNAILQQAGNRISFAFRFDTLPAATVAILQIWSSASNNICGIQLTSAGLLTLATGSTLATGTTTLAVNTWYRITFAYTATSSTVNELRCFLDGVQEVTFSNATLSNLPPDRIATGWLSSSVGTNRICWLDDVYVDDGTTLDDPGDVHLTAKLPTSINTNTFDTTVTTGLLNQRPISTTSGRSQTGTGAATCNLNIETAAGGDVDISSATLLGYMGWIWAGKGSGVGTPTDNITVNGTDTVVTLTTTATFYSSVVTSGTYPSDPATIGMNRSVGAAPDCAFSECGIVFAYIPGVAGVTPFGFDPWLAVQEPPRRIVHVPY